ncbi:uncharacterized protein LOC131885665 [Tigriopus californicus]|uniref:uncharacterized protein LOC131885665 n=1 Tax=Tigriopus californicus TaxID=6832 RepID=UPI0027DA4A70|nr:uncharacterized protein LOC131885665 [Tigriopus californicus]
MGILDKSFRLAWISILIFSQVSGSTGPSSSGRRLTSLLSNLKDFNLGGPRGKRDFYHDPSREMNEAYLENIGNRIASATSNLIATFRLLAQAHNQELNGSLAVEKRLQDENTLQEILEGMEAFPESPLYQDYVRHQPNAGEYLRLTKKSHRQLI